MGLQYQQHEVSHHYAKIDLHALQDIYEDTKNQYMTIDDALDAPATTALHDLSDSSGVSSEPDSGGGGMDKFTRSQYRVLQVRMGACRRGGRVVCCV